jgi:peptidoglycan/LPS O-acetylase OafA/YrhL
LNQTAANDKVGKLLARQFARRWQLEIPREPLNTRVRFPELDLVRFCAACAVMLFHFTFRGPQINVWSAGFPLLGQIFKYGYLGVNVFFILSGFVILLTAYEKDALAFSFARMVRLYPAYWVCVSLTSLAIVLAGNVRHLTPFQYFANLTMVHSYFGVTDISGVYWTLAVELKFYFLVFLVLAIRQIHRMGYFLGLWLLASILLSFSRPHGVLVFFLFPEWSSYFIAGATFFLIYRDGLNLYKTLVIALCYGLSVAYAVNLVPAAGADLSRQTSAPVLIVLLTVFYLMFFAIALRRTSFQRSSKFCYVLGMITYPLYLVHQDIGYLLLHSAPGGWNRYLLLSAVMSAMIGLAWLVHVGPEKFIAFRLKALLAQVAKIGSSMKAIGRMRNPLRAPVATAGLSAVAATPAAPIYSPKPVERTNEMPAASDATPPITGNVGPSPSNI